MLIIMLDFGEADHLLEENHGHYVFRDMETTRRVSSEMGLAVHGDLGCNSQH